MQWENRDDTELIFALVPRDVGSKTVWLEWYERRFCGYYYNVLRTGIPFKEGLKLWWARFRGI